MLIVYKINFFYFFNVHNSFPLIATSNFIKYRKVCSKSALQKQQNVPFLSGTWADVVLISKFTFLCSIFQLQAFDC